MHGRSSTTRLNRMKIQGWLVRLLVLALPVSFLSANAATYYIHFDEGLDSNDGLTETSPWMHAPGDPNASGDPSAVTLLPGDIVQFRGDVIYRGSLLLDDSGEEGNPIVYKGDGWGPNNAFLDGSEPLESLWTPCASAADCRDNANWEMIYYADAPPGFTALTPLYQGDEFQFFSQHPNPIDAFDHDRFLEYRILPLNDSERFITSSSVTDPTFLTQSDPSFYDGGYIQAYFTGNVLPIARITSFDPATNTLLFEDVGRAPYTDRDEYYTILSVVGFIDRPGEMAFDPDANRIYAWPSVGDPNDIPLDVGERRVGIQVRGRDHIVIEGFIIQKFWGDLGDDSGGGGITSTTDSAVGLTIRNNVIRMLRSLEGQSAIRVIGDGVVIDNNQILLCQSNRGILVSGDEISVINNVLDHISRTGIFFFTCTNGRIAGNLLRNIRGQHANGISVYVKSANTILENNILIDINSMLTIQDLGGDLTIQNNLFWSNGDAAINEWGGGVPGTTVKFVNNTAVGNDAGGVLSIGKSSPNVTYFVQNNILDGAGMEDAVMHSNNLFLDLHRTQSLENLGPGDFLEEDWNAVFVDPAAGDYRLRVGSPAIDAGASIGVLEDIDGNSRARGTAPDIGAFEGGVYEEGQSTTLSVIISGAATPLSNFQWIKDGVLIPGAMELTLFFPSLGISDTGTYTLQYDDASKDGPFESDPIVVTVVALGSFPAPAAIPLSVTVLTLVMVTLGALRLRARRA